MKDYDIICLSETKVKFLDMCNFSLEGFSCIIKENLVKNHRYGGVHGICMFVKDDYFRFTRILKDVMSPYMLWVKFGKEAFGI